MNECMRGKMPNIKNARFSLNWRYEQMRQGGDTIQMSGEVECPLGQGNRS